MSQSGVYTLHSVDLGRIGGYLGVLATSTFAISDDFKLTHGNFWYNKVILIFDFEQCQVSFFEFEVGCLSFSFQFSTYYSSKV